MPGEGAGKDPTGEAMDARGDLESVTVGGNSDTGLSGDGNDRGDFEIGEAGN